MDSVAVLHGCRFHTSAPLATEDAATERAWHLSLDLAYGGDGVCAMQLVAFDPQPFSYGTLTYHRASPKPGALDNKVTKDIQRFMRAPGCNGGPGCQSVRGRGGLAVGLCVPVSALRFIGYE